MTQLTNLVVVALKAEWSDLRGRLEFRKHPDFPSLHHCTDFPDGAVLQTGMGPKRAEDALTRFLANHAARRVFHFGWCGALTEPLHPCDLFIPTRVNDEDGQAIAIDHQGLTERLRASGSTCRHGELLSVATPLATPDDKRRAHATHSCAAADMESFAVAQICERRAVAYVAARGVFDTLNDDISAFVTPTDAQGQPRIGALLANQVKRPQRILDLPVYAKRHQTLTRAFSKLAQDFFAGKF